MSPEHWQKQLETSLVHLQWDPERSLRVASLQYNSIQIGLSRHIIQEFVDDWVTEIEDVTKMVRKIHSSLQSGKTENLQRQWPEERPYPVSGETGRRILLS